MATSLMLGEAGFTADEMNTTAQVTLEQDGGGFTITHVALTLRAKIPNIDDAKFQEITAKAKAGCPVSKLFKADISLDAKLV
jgi:osmotically inducible protein OsmC